MLETVFVVDDGDYLCWQADLLAFTHASVAQPGGVTRLLVADVHEPPFDGQTVMVTPESHFSAAYLPYNKPHAVTAWLQAADAVPAEILLVDPDCAFVAQCSLPAVAGQPCAQPAPYLDPFEHAVLVRRHGLDPSAVQSIGIPIVIHRDDLRRLAPAWLARTRDILEDQVSRQDAGWLAEMWGYAFAAASIGLRHRVLPIAHRLGEDSIDRPLIHYCDRMVDGNGGVVWDKRSYAPWTPPPPDDGDVTLTDATLLDMLDRRAAAERERATPAGDNGAFCILPWIHLCASVDGVYGRCCHDSSMYHYGYYEQGDEPAFVLKPDAVGCSAHSRYAAANPERVYGIADAFNTPQLRATRKAMLAGQRPQACASCHAREDAGARSSRQKVNDQFRHDELARAYVARTADDGTVAAFPFYLDIRFSNVCNLRCVMCSFPISSRLGKENAPAWAAAVIDPYSDDGDLWATLEANAHLIRKLYFAGGEPFLSRGHVRLLELLAGTGDAEHVELIYTSNLTVLPERVIAKFPRFSSVGIGASCDGVGAVFESIRRGARWQRFVTNLRRARTVARVWLQVAVQRDNVEHLAELVEFAHSEGVSLDLSNLVQWPPDLSIASLPATDKARAARALRELIEDCRHRSLTKAADELAAALAYMTA